jgi:hypothetical protein
MKIYEIYRRLECDCCGSYYELFDIYAEGPVRGIVCKECIDKFEQEEQEEEQENNDD